jgi:hypothetical protein
MKADAPPLRGGVRLRAREVDAAALPRVIQHLADRCLDALMPSEITSLTPRKPPPSELAQTPSRRGSALDGTACRAPRVGRQS